MNDNRKCMEEIYKMISEKTIKRLKKEKATKVSEQTFRLIALTRELYYDLTS